MTPGGKRESFVVRIAVGEGSAAPAAGVGVVVGDGKVMTCAHVVNVAIGRPKQELSPPPGEARVHVKLPLLSGAATAECAVVSWLPPSPESPGEGDVAVLAVVNGSLPEGAEPAGFLPADESYDEQVEVFGYPSDPPRKEAGGWATCIVRGAVGGGAVQLDTDPTSALRPQPGYSGSPVIRREMGRDRVIGLLVVASRDNRTKDAYAVGLATLRSALPDLATVPITAETAVDRVEGDRISPSVPYWRDRDERKAELRQLLLGGQRITAVTGRRGIGKSALVARVLSEFEQADSKREVDLNALAYLSTRTGRGELTFARIYETLTQLAPESERKQLLKRLEKDGRDALPGLWEALDKAQRTVVVVLNDLDGPNGLAGLQDPDTGEVVDQQLLDFLASACSTPWPPRVVTTSIRPPVLPPELRLHVTPLDLYEGLPDEDAVALLRAHDTYGDAGLAELTDEQLVAVAQRLHGVPRALELLPELLERDETTLDRVLASPAAPEVLLKKLVAANFDQLSEQRRAVMRILALAGVPLPERDVPEILHGVIEEEDARTAVHQLRRRRLVGRDRKSGLVRLHPIDADYISQACEAHDHAQYVVLSRRLADWYAGRRTPPDTWRLIADAEPNMLEFRHRLRAGEPDAAIDALTDAAAFLSRRGESGVVFHAVDSIEPFLDSDAQRAPVQLSLALAEFFNGSLERAEAALRAAHEMAAAGPSSLLPSIDGWLGAVLRHRGRATAAVPVLAGVLSSPDVPRSIRVGALFELALSFCYLGDAPGAVDATERLAVAVGDDGSPVERGYLGDARALTAVLTGDRAAALAAAAEAIAAYQQSPKWDDAGYLQNLCGIIHLDLDDLDAAADDLEQALQSARDSGQGRLFGFATANLAWLRLRQGRMAEAREMAQSSADRLAAAHVDEAASPRLLAELLQTGVVDVGRLREVVALTQANPDFYRPSEQVVENLRATLAPAQ